MAVGSWPLAFSVLGYIFGFWRIQNWTFLNWESKVEHCVSERSSQKAFCSLFPCLVLWKERLAYRVSIVGADSLQVSKVLCLVLWKEKLANRWSIAGVVLFKLVEWSSSGSLVEGRFFYILFTYCKSVRLFLVELLITIYSD